MTQLINEMYLVLGDPSKDGHSFSDKKLFLCNKTVSEIQQAYKDSCKLTGISFNHNNDYTCKDRTLKTAKQYRICTEFENDKLNDITIDTLEEFNCPMFEKIKANPTIESHEQFCELWFWFVTLSLSDLEWQIKTRTDNIPEINVGVLNVQFGYGLYYF